MKIILLILIFTLTSLATYAEVISTKNSKNQEALLARSEGEIEFVTVGDPNNVPEQQTQLGSVMIPYRIGKYEVTVEQWCDFLNAVASYEDPHGLYDIRMNTDVLVSSIYRISDEHTKTYSYLSFEESALFPITYVSYDNALRFCNWHENGRPTCFLKNEILKACTEHGAYDFGLSASEREMIVSAPNAHYFLPTESQWVKAAYYAGSGTNAPYWLYPTQHNTPPNTDEEDLTNKVNIEYPSNSLISNNRALKPVDYYRNTQGAYGTCDMGGNVAEWMTSDHVSSLSTLIPVIRGASWASNSFDDLLISTPAQYYDSTESALGNNKTGFRVAAVILDTIETLSPLSAREALSSSMKATPS